MKNIFWWSRRKLHKMDLENFGDFLVPFLLNRLSYDKFQWVDPKKKKNKFVLFSVKHYFIIGSILHFATEDTIVWGAGIIKKNLPVKKAKFLAVRGPLTRSYLIDLGYQVPEKYGDPAILLKLFNILKKKKKYSLGVVPHIVDYEETKRKLEGFQDVLVIDLLTNNPATVIDDIQSCEKILSSSLHGIIVSHSLEIPALWMKISDKLFGDDVKFYDYYSSIKIDSPPILSFNFCTIMKAEMLFEQYSEFSLPDVNCIRVLIKDLIETFPFQKSHFFKEAIKTFNYQSKKE